MMPTRLRHWGTALVLLGCGTAPGWSQDLPGGTTELAGTPEFQLATFNQPTVAPAPTADPSTVPELPDTQVIATPEATGGQQPTPPAPGGQGTFQTPGQRFQEAFSTSLDGPFITDVEGTRIFDGKKTVNFNLDERPPISNNNFRQAFSTLPSLLIAEESTPLVSFGYRGLPPDRGQFMMITKDGIPIQADPIGYPEAYYVPALQSVERIEFVHGGAALMYGPQPGGALNFVTKSPVPGQDFEAYTENLFGTWDYFSTYNSISNFNGPMGYYAYAHHRQSDGFRQANSDYDLSYAGAKFVTNLSPTARTIVGFDLYDESHAEPGLLSMTDFYTNQDRTKTTRFFDQFQLRRYSAWAKYQVEINEDAYFESKFWMTYYDRKSRRQTGAGFGAPSASATANFASQEFRSIGTDNRLRLNYGTESQHVLSAGFMTYHTDSPLNSLTGPTSAPVGTTPTSTVEREINYLSFFAENRFQFNRLSITPGMRFENIWQNIQEQYTTQVRPLRSDDVYEFQPLFGVGSEYEWTDTMRSYANISQSYRPQTFGQTVAVGAVNTVVDGNLAPGQSYQAEIGLRDAPTSYFFWDTSLFYMDFNDQIGNVTQGPLTVISNVGDAYYRGAEIVLNVDLVRLTDEIYDTNLACQYGGFTLFFSEMFLDAKFYNGNPNVVGKTPQYAPSHQMRTGAMWQRGQSQLAFSGTMVDDVFGDDANTTTPGASLFIPSYTVWDLTASFYVTPKVAIVAGINNVFDEFYTARVNANGIDPGTPRNYYLGFQAGY